MFQLEEEVRDFCSSILPDDCAQNERVEELEDHLHSEIERLQTEGLTQEQAFNTATDNLGEAKMLMSEYSKNRTFISRLCALDRQLSGTDTITSPALRKKANHLVIGHAILWAVAIIASALLLRNSDADNSQLMLVFVGLWFGSYLLITQTFRSMKPNSEARPE